MLVGCAMVRGELEVSWYSTLNTPKRALAKTRSWRQASTTWARMFMRSKRLARACRGGQGPWGLLPGVAQPGRQGGAGERLPPGPAAADGAGEGGPPDQGGALEQAEQLGPQPGRPLQGMRAVASFTAACSLSMI